TGVRLFWHLGPDDFRPARQAQLMCLTRWALEGGPVTFVLDRPRHPFSLGPGMDRQHPAALMLIGLHLPRLAEQLGTKVEEGLFLKKLASLARIALSAGTQKRDFLRRHSQARPNLIRGFLLERARLVIVPMELESLVQSVIGRSIGSGGTALEFA